MGAIVEIRDFSFWFGENQVLKNISFNIIENCITAIMGPSGCGKSTLLRSINRMNELYENTKHSGNIFYRGRDIFSMNVYELRRKITMVFQKPNPFPKSIFENVAFGLKIQGIKDKDFIYEKVKESLEKAWLWDEVKDNLHKSAFYLSGGQQQRLCIARCLAVSPDVLLLDEPTSALDPVGAGRIEELLLELKNSITIVIVTHNPQQAARISDYIAFLYLGELIEFGETDEILTKPKNELTERYLTGKFG